MTMPVQKAVAMVLRREDGAFLSVQRPPSDQYLANVWGLPAGTIKTGETPENAVHRAAREKLGVHVRIRRCLGSEIVYRPTFELQMTEFEVEVITGTPQVPQKDESITQYVAARFTTDVSTLIEAAQRGSACCRVFLRDLEYPWAAPHAA